MVRWSRGEIIIPSGGGTGGGEEQEEDQTVFYSIEMELHYSAAGCLFPK